MNNDLIKAVARALLGYQFGRRAEDFKNAILPDETVDEAIAAIAAIESSGWAVVPKEATKGMHIAGAVINWGAPADVEKISLRTWPAMLSARPKILPDQESESDRRERLRMEGGHA